MDVAQQGQWKPAPISVHGACRRRDAPVVASHPFESAQGAQPRPAGRSGATNGSGIEAQGSRSAITHPSCCRDIRRQCLVNGCRGGFRLVGSGMRDFTALFEPTVHPSRAHAMFCGSRRRLSSCDTYRVVMQGEASDFGILLPGVTRLTITREPIQPILAPLTSRPSSNGGQSPVGRA